MSTVSHRNKETNCTISHYCRKLLLKSFVSFVQKLGWIIQFTNVLLKSHVHTSSVHTFVCFKLMQPHFFLPPAAASCFCSQETTFPSITTPFPSIKATRERPSQFLKLSQTKGCCGWKAHSAISLDFKLWGSSIFLPPVSLPIFQTPC